MSDSTETPGLAAAREARKELVAALRDCHLVVAHQAANEVEALAADLSALRIEHDAVRGLLTHTRRERDDARDELQRLWDATEADRARMAVIEATTHGYPTGARAVVVGPETDIRQLLVSAATTPLAERMPDPMPVLDFTVWTDAPMATPPNRAQRRAKDKP